MLQIKKEFPDFLRLDCYNISIHIIQASIKFQICFFLSFMHSLHMDLHQQSKLLATEAKTNFTADLFEPSRFDPAKHFPLQPPVLEHREKHPGIKSLSDFSFTGPNQSNTLQYQHGLTMATSLMLRVARGTSATVRVDGSVPVVPSPFAYQRLQANKRTACLCCIFEFGLHPASCLSDAFLVCNHPLSTTTKHIDSPFSPKIARIHSSYIL